MGGILLTNLDTDIIYTFIKCSFIGIKTILGGLIYD